MTDNTKMMEFAGMKVRLREGQPGSFQHLVVLLHGWTGDENSMWIFSENIPLNYWVIAPRGIYKAGTKGYSWRNIELSKTWDTPDINEFTPAISFIEKMLDSFSGNTGIPVDSFDIMGFSQGAALASSFLLSRSKRIAKTVLLAGFLPEIPNTRDFTASQVLHNKKIFIAHGNQDEMVPISKSIAMAESLESMGANISFCTDDVGHKVGRHCFQGLLAFFED